MSTASLMSFYSCSQFSNISGRRIRPKSLFTAANTTTQTFSFYSGQGRATIRNSAHSFSSVTRTPGDYYNATTTKTTTTTATNTNTNTIKGRLILLRHGQSEWNVTDPVMGTTARFTGWANIGLTERGIKQAVAAGQALHQALIVRHRLSIDSAFSSLLSRSQDTLHLALQELDLVCCPTTSTTSTTTNHSDVTSIDKDAAYRIPVTQSWRLNERHYGELVGLSKDGAERHFGKEKLDIWRNSWSTAPPAMSEKKLSGWKRLPHCQMITKVKMPHQTKGREYDILEHEHPGKLINHFSNGSSAAAATSSHYYTPPPHTLATPQMPGSESMRDTYLRVLPLWTEAIAPRLRLGENVLLSAHANTIRAMLHFIDPIHVSPDKTKKIKIPSAKPLVFTFRPATSGDSSGDSSRTRVIIHGNLVVLNGDGSEIEDDIERSDKEDDDTITMLNGYWIDDENIEYLSFCSDYGHNLGEQEIA